MQGDDGIVIFEELENPQAVFAAIPGKVQPDELAAADGRSESPIYGRGGLDRASVAFLQSQMRGAS